MTTVLVAVRAVHGFCSLKSGTKLISRGTRQLSISSASKHAQQQFAASSSEKSFRQDDSTETSGESSNSNHENQSDESNFKDEEAVKSEILNVALNYVQMYGWSVNSISAAAEELNLAPSISGLFKDYDLVSFFILKNNIELEEHLSENQLDIRDALEWRLKKVVPYINGYTEAVAIAAQPRNLSHSIGLLQQCADSIAHHSLKDISTDLNWYTKRVAIAGLYMSAEMCLIQDKSEGQIETWKFLDRRADQFAKLKKGDFVLGGLPIPLPELFQAGVITLKNVLGRNSRR